MPIHKNSQAMKPILNFKINREVLPVRLERGRGTLHIIFRCEWELYTSTGFHLTCAAQNSWIGTLHIPTIR